MLSSANTFKISDIQQDETEVRLTNWNAMLHWVRKLLDGVFGRHTARFPSPMPGESSGVPKEDRVGLNHLQTSPPTGPESRQHNPQESVAAVVAHATRRVLLENRKLVTKRED